MQGQQIGNWIIDEKIDEGGMGEVWKAHHYFLNTMVAIKVLHRLLANDPQFVARFKAEVIAQAKLQHPNIVRVSDFFQYQGAYYIVMPFIEGQSLERRLQTGQVPLPKHEVLSISQDILSSLDYTHQHSVIHRDVKPANILIDQAGRAYLADFGIALMIGEERRTRTGVAVGTPHYMSPEQIINPKQMDHRTDVYSFGCVLYEMLTGRPPFDAQSGDGDTDFIIKNCHITQMPEPVHKLNAQIPAEVEIVVMRALAKKPDERFISCGEFARALVYIGQKAEEVIHCVHCHPPVPLQLGREFCDKCGKSLRRPIRVLPSVPSPLPSSTHNSPPKLSLEKAKKHVRNAWIATLISSAILLLIWIADIVQQTVPQTESEEQLIRQSILGLIVIAGLIWAIAFGIYKYSRACALIMLGILFSGAIAFGVAAETLGTLIAMFLTYWLVQGVRGTFAYHRHQTSAQDTLHSDSQRKNWYFEVLQKYAVFSGRARRKEYWMFFLFNLITSFILVFIEGMLEGPGIVANLYTLAVLIPAIAVGVRRMHDTDHSGWWLLVPIVNFVFAVQEGQSGENRFGTDPKGKKGDFNATPPGKILNLCLSLI